MPARSVEPCDTGRCCDGAARQTLSFAFAAVTAHARAMRCWLAIVALTACGARSGAPAERRAAPGQRCAEHEWTIVDPGPLVAVPPPAHYTCVRCASREDVLVAIDVPPERPPFAPAEPDAWRCMQRCYADYQCKVGRCVSGWFDPHCDEPGRLAIFEHEAPATLR